MALATRCPHCQTAFRVASDQLKLRAGLVRCGTCKEIFNGIENLLHPDEDIAAAIAASAPPVPEVPLGTPAAAVQKPVRGDNTRFNDLIAEVDHAAVAAGPTSGSDYGNPGADGAWDVGAAHGDAVAMPHQHGASAGSGSTGGYAVHYAPVRLAPLPVGPTLHAPPHAGAEFDLHYYPAGAAEQARDGPDSSGRVQLDGAQYSEDDGKKGSEHGSEDDGPDRSEGDSEDDIAVGNDVRSEDDSDALWRALSEEPTGSGTGLMLHPIDEPVIATKEGIAPAPPADLSPPSLPGLLRAASIDDDEATRLPVDDALFKPHSRNGVRLAAGRLAPAAGTVTAARLADTADKADEADEADERGDEAADDPPDFVARDQRRQGLDRTVRPLLVGGSLLLGIILAAQAVYAARTGIAANFPETRPAFEQACRILGCSVGLPTQIESVSIESSDFQPVVGSIDQFTLSVLLRNRGTTVQTWPSIELSLTDNADKPVGRRVLGPLDYLPAGVPVAKGFAAGSEQAIRLSFDMTRLKAAGYRVYLFYP